LTRHGIILQKQKMLIGLLNQDKLLNAGKVLFCSNNNVELQLAVFATDTKATFFDIDKKNGTVFELMRAAQDYIMKTV